MARDIRRTGWLGAKPKVYVYGEAHVGDTLVVGQRVDDPREAPVSEPMDAVLKLALGTLVVLAAVSAMMSVAMSALLVVAVIRGMR